MQDERRDEAAPEASAPAESIPGQPSTRAALLTLTAVLSLLLLAAWSIINTPLAGWLSGMRFKYVGALGLELISLGLPLTWLLGRGRYDIRASLGLNPVGPFTLAGAGLIGSGLIAVAPQLEAWQARLFPPPPEYLEGLTDFLTTDSGESLALALLTLAVVPAFLEEALFRGILLRSALVRWGRWPSVFGIGLLFGLFHLDLYRWPLLSVIGIALTWVAVESGSLWPAVVAHLANNGLAIGLVNLDSIPNQDWVEGISDVPPEFFLSGLALILLGAWLVRRASAHAVDPDLPIPPE